MTSFYCLPFLAIPVHNEWMFIIFIVGIMNNTHVTGLPFSMGLHALVHLYHVQSSTIDISLLNNTR